MFASPTTHPLVLLTNWRTLGSVTILKFLYFIISCSCKEVEMSFWEKRTSSINRLIVKKTKTLSLFQISMQNFLFIDGALINRKEITSLCFLKFE